MDNTSGNTLKAIFLVHFIFATWGIQGSWSPQSYFFYNAIFFILVIWGLHHRDSEDPLQMALCVNVLSIFFDIIVLCVYYPIYIKLIGSERFSIGMAIINLLLRPISSVGLYRSLQDRTGLGGSGFSGNFGNLFGTSRQRSPYEDIDRPSTMPNQSTPDAPHATSSPSEKPYYNIVG